MTHLTLTTLGTMTVTRNSEPLIGFDSNKVRALLVFLAIESQRAHARDGLAAMLWPNFDNRTALNNLRYALSNLRKTIGDRDTQPPFLLIDNRTLARNTAAAITVDVDAFTQRIQSNRIDDVEQAIKMYGGPFLDGFSIADSAVFEDWLIRHRARYHHLMVVGLKYLSDVYERYGSTDEALYYARWQIDLEPWNEIAHQQAMRLLARSNQRSDALAQYKKCCQALDDELGVDPCAETTMLYNQIRDNSFVTPPAVPSFLMAEKPQIPAVSGSFVGRDDELMQLDTHLRNMLEGRGKIVFVIGEAGSGKTSLVRAFTQHTLTQYSEVVVVSGQCPAQFGVGDPYIPFLNILRMLSGDVEDQYLSGSVSRTHAQRLWDTMPQFLDALLSKASSLIDRFISSESLLQRVRSGAPQQTLALEAVLAAPIRHAASLRQSDLFEQYTGILQKVASTVPLVLVIDDLHWADVGSINLLFHLGQRLHGHRVMVIGLYRPNELASGLDGSNVPLSRIINEFIQKGAPTVDLEQADGYAFINALIDDEPNRLDANFRDQLYQHTLGHPLFAAELLARLRQDDTLARDASGQWYVRSRIEWKVLPPRVEAAIADRIERLPPDLYELIRMASVAGDRFTAQVVANALDRPVAGILEQLSGPLMRDYQLVTAQSAERHNGQLLAHYRFRHVLFQTYLYSQIDRVTQAYLHSAVVDAMEGIYGTNKPEQAAKLAHHFEHAQRIEQAIDYRRSAGDYAVQLFANDEAIQHYRRALDLLHTLPESDQRLEQQLELRIALGVPLLASRGFGDEELADNYQLARQLGHRVTNPMANYRALAGLKSYYDLRLELEVAAELASELLRLATMMEDDRLIMLSTHHIAVTQMYRGDFMGFIANRRKAHAMHDPDAHHDLTIQVGFDPEIAGLAHESWTLWIIGFADQARQRAQEAVVLADARKHPFMRAMAYVFAGRLHCLLQDMPATAELSQIASELSHEIGMPFWGISADILCIWAMDDVSRVSLDDICQMNDAMRAMGSELVRLGTTTQIAQICSRLGELDYGLEILDKGIEQVLHTGYLQTIAEYYVIKGELLALKGEFELAEAMYEKALSWVTKTGAHGWGLRAGTSLANLLYCTDRLENANSLLNAVMAPIAEGYWTTDWQNAQDLLNRIVVH